MLVRYALKYVVRARSVGSGADQMGQPEAQVAALEFRRALEKEQAAQARELLNSYKPVYRQLSRDTELLVRKAETVGLKDWQNMRLERLESL